MPEQESSHSHLAIIIGIVAIVAVVAVVLAMMPRNNAGQAFLLPTETALDSPIDTATHDYETGSTCGDGVCEGEEVDTCLADCESPPDDGGGGGGGGGDEWPHVVYTDVYYQESLPAASYDDYDLTGFMNDVVYLGSTSAAVEDELIVKANGLSVQTSSDPRFISFGPEPYLVFDNNGGPALQYQYSFEDNKIDINTINNHQETLTIEFAGKTLSINGVYPGQLLFSAYKSKTVLEGAVFYADNHRIELISVADSSAKVKVDDQTLIIEEGHIGYFDQVDDYPVRLVAGSITYNDPLLTNSAVLNLGDPDMWNVHSGDPATVFAEPDDENLAEWIWGTIAVSQDGYLQYITMDYNQNRDRADHPAFPALAEGEARFLPDKYGQVIFTGVTTDDYEPVIISTNTTMLGNVTTHAMQFRAEQPIIIVGGRSTPKAYVQRLDSMNYQLWYLDTTGQVVKGPKNEPFYIQRGADYFTVRPNNILGMWAIESPGTTQEIEFAVSSSSSGYDYIGVTGGPDVALPGELFVDGKDVSFQVDVLTDYGVEIPAAHTLLTMDTIVLNIPDERPQATILFKGKPVTAPVEPPVNDTEPMQYLDPTKCEFNIFYPEPGSQYTAVQCSYMDGKQGYVGLVTHIDCPHYQDMRFLTATAWAGDGSGDGYDTLPGYMAYTCVGYQDYQWRAPSQIFAFCCEIQGTETPDGAAPATQSVSRTATVDPATGQLIMQ